MGDIPNMNINSIQPLNPLQEGVAKPQGPGGVNFKDILRKSIDDVNSMNQKADQALEKLATGEIQDMHQVMVAIEKADLTFKTMMQVRNKLVDAYQEMMKMRF